MAGNHRKSRRPCCRKSCSRLATKLTPERARELFRYDPLTGEFSRRISVGRFSAGSRAGYNSDGYRRVGIDGRPYRVHRVIWLMMTGRWPNDVIDHINGNRSDNRFCNLRELSRSENARIRHPNPNKGSGVPGVGENADTGEFVATLRVGRRTHHLGTYATLEQAVTAWRKAEQKFGVAVAAANDNMERDVKDDDAA